MKNFVGILILLSVFLSSCDGIYFDQIPGEKLNEVPTKFIGKYKIRNSSFINDAENIRIKIFSDKIEIIDSIDNKSLNYQSDFLVYELTNNNDTMNLFAMSKDNGFYHLTIIETSRKGKLELLPVIFSGIADTSNLSNYFTSRKVLINSDSVITYQIQNPESLFLFYKRELRRKSGLILIPDEE